MTASSTPPKRVSFLTSFIFCMTLISGSTGIAFAGHNYIKPGPVGIVNVVRGDTAEHRFTTLGDDPAWDNPEVKGFFTRASWEVIEPTEGNIDFSFFDQALQLAHKHNKFLGLCVIAGRYSPQWIYADGAQELNQTRSGNRGPITLPAPWNPIFQEKWRNLIKAFGARYDGDPNIAYVNMTGPGRDIETFFVRSSSDIATFENTGGQARWEAAAVTIAGYYAEAFPHTPITYAMGPPTPDRAGHETIMRVVNTLLRNYPGQFGISSNALTPRYYPVPPSAEVIRANSATTTVGFQMYLPDKDGTNMNGPLSEALQNGINYKAHYIEVYSYDCNDPIQQAALHQANVELMAIATKRLQ